MDDQVLVRAVHRRAHDLEQPQPLLDAERARIAIDVDRLAVDILHDDVRRAVGGRAAVEQPRDVRMIERRQDLAFELQPALHLARQQPAPHQLDRDLLLELLVGALGEEHLAHAAAAEAAHDAIGADALAGEVDRRVLGSLRRDGAVVAEPLLARFELVHRARVQIAVGRARLANEAQPLVRRQGLRLVEDLLQGLGRHCRHLSARGAPPVLRSS